MRMVDSLHNGRELSECVNTASQGRGHDSLLQSQPRAAFPEASIQSNEVQLSSAKYLDVDSVDGVRQSIGVRRELSGTFDLIRTRALSVEANIALDHAIAASVREGVRPAAVRIWDWDTTAIVMGSSQSLSNEVDWNAAQSRGVRVARRASGGGTMFMDPLRAITYSVIIPEEKVADLSLRESYAVCDSWVLRALHRLGVPAFYRPINDIATREGKIGGAAQRRIAGGVVIHHAAMSWEINTEELMAVTRLFRPDTGARGTKSAQKKVVGIHDYVDVTRDEVIEALTVELCTAQRGKHGRLRTVRESRIRPKEIALAERLVKEKFGTEKWLRKIP